MVGVVGIIIKINSFFFQKPPGYETVSARPGPIAERRVDGLEQCSLKTRWILIKVTEDYQELARRFVEYGKLSGDEKCRTSVLKLA